MNLKKFIKGQSESAGIPWYLRSFGFAAEKGWAGDRNLLKESPAGSAPSAGFQFSPQPFLKISSKAAKVEGGNRIMDTMNGMKRATRQTIVREIHDLMEKWPESEDQEYLLRAENAVGELEALANEMDETCPDRLERARNWRQVGNAYANLSVNAGLERLEAALAAYKRAEILLAGIQEPVERILLSCSYGNALLARSRRNDLWMLEEAREKFAQAFELAEKEMPAALETIGSALKTADQVIDVLHKRQEILRQIAAYKRRSLISSAPDSGSDEMHEESHLFEMLIANYNEAAQIQTAPDLKSAEWARRVN